MTFGSALTSRSADQPIQYEPEEPCPPIVALIVGFQGAALVLAPTVLNVAIGFRAAGLDETWLVWGVFAGMLTCAAMTALQVFRLGQFGTGHVVLSWSSAIFLAILATTVEATGPETFASLLIVCSLLQIALARWLPALRRIITPVVSGTVTMLIAVSVLPIAFNSVQNVPPDAAVSAGPVIAVVTLLASVIVTLRVSGRWRLIAPLISIVVGCAVSAAFGVFEVDRIANAAWFGVPELPDLGFDLSPGKEFWALLPTFAILTLVFTLKTISDGVVIQQNARRRPRAIDFRQIQGLVSASGIGMLLAGLSTTLPPASNASYSNTLVSLTGVAARRVGIGVALVTVVLAFFSKFAALLLSVPGPVLGAFLMLAMGMLFVSGWQTILRDGLDPRRVLVVALASALGLGLHGHPLLSDLLGEELGGLIGNGVTIGAIVAIAMTLLLEAMGSRSSKLEVTLDMASLPAIDEYLSALASRLKWDEPSTLRLRSAGEETLSSLLTLEDDQADESSPTRLIIVARPQPLMVELEFVATTHQENIEDQVAYLTEADALPTAEDISLRLLRFHTSALRHQKFHGVDIVTIQVEGSS